MRSRRRRTSEAENDDGRGGGGKGRRRSVRDTTGPSAGNKNSTFALCRHIFIIIIMRVYVCVSNIENNTQVRTISFLRLYPYDIRRLWSYVTNGVVVLSPHGLYYVEKKKKNPIKCIYYNIYYIRQYRNTRVRVRRVRVTV